MLKGFLYAVLKVYIKGKKQSTYVGCFLIVIILKMC